MAVGARPKMTYAEYIALTDDGRRREIIDGVAYAVRMPSMRHQRLLGRTFCAFSNHLSNQGGGHIYLSPLAVVLSDHDIVQPDVIFVSDAEPRYLTEGSLHGPPTLIVEVLSDPYHDLVRKRALYARSGVPDYWIVDPDSDRVEVHQLEGDTYPPPRLHLPGSQLTYDRLPGLVIDVAELFSE